MTGQKSRLRSGKISWNPMLWGQGKEGESTHCEVEEYETSFCIWIPSIVHCHREVSLPSIVTRKSCRESDPALYSPCWKRAGQVEPPCPLELHAHGRCTETLTRSLRAVNAHCHKGEEEVKAADGCKEVKLTLTDSESVPHYSHVPVFSGRVK